MSRAVERREFGFIVKRVTHVAQSDVPRRGKETERQARTKGWRCWHVSEFTGNVQAQWDGQHYLKFADAFAAVVKIAQKLNPLDTLGA